MAQLNPLAGYKITANTPGNVDVSLNGNHAATFRRFCDANTFCDAMNRRHDMELTIDTNSWNEICRDVQNDDPPPHMSPVITYNRETGVFKWDSQLNPMDENEYVLGRLEDAMQWFDGPVGDWSEYDIRYFATPIIEQATETDE